LGTGKYDLQFDNVRMSQKLKITDFSFDSSGHVSGDEFLPVDDLQGDLFSANIVNGELDFAKGTLSQCPNDIVLTKTVVGSIHKLGSLPLLLTGPWILRTIIWSIGISARARRRYGEGKFLIVKS
jgi:hypothetical protein